MNKRFYGALLFRASLVAFVAHFLILPSAYANLNTSVPPTWMIDGDTPNPYPISIGTEPATPLNQVSTLTMGARAAASASSETVDVDGTLSSPMIAVSAIGTSGQNQNEFDSLRGDVALFHDSLNNPCKSMLDAVLNSVTMDWVGIGGSVDNPNDGDWVANRDRMQSVQAVSGRSGQVFMDGDKVHITNANLNELTVSLPDSSSGQTLTVTVSGLVVGRTGSDTSPLIGNGNVTIDGDGGITADATSAVGSYLPGETGTPTLVPTGKLEKYGNGRLTLKNAGPNIFNEGTDVHGGEILVAAPDASTRATIFSQALDVTGTADSLRGHVRYTGTAGDTRQVTIDAGIVGINNHFHIDAGMVNNTFQNNDDLSIVALANNSTVQNLGGVFYIGQNAELTINANGSLTLNDNTYQSSGPVANDIYIDSNATVNFTVASGKGVFIGSGVGADGVTGSTINKIGEGLVQIGRNSLFGGATYVRHGTFRVVGDGSGVGSETVVYGQGTSGIFAMTSQVDQNSVLAGSGIIIADNFTFGTAGSGGNVYIRPDAATFTASSMEVENDKRYATLTLRGSGTGKSTATFYSPVDPTQNTRDGFWFDYDVAAPNAAHEDKADVTDAEKDRSSTKNDLLYLEDISTVTLNGGVINFQSGTGLTTGQYLVIDSDSTILLPSSTSTIDGINDSDGVLSGKLNGEDIHKDSPRGSAEFYMDNRNGQPANSQVWLAVSHNSLQMDWTGGDGAWGRPGAWVSRQIGSKGERNYQFTNGDFVYFAGNSSNTITLTDNVIVCGMTAGRNSSEVVANNDVTLRGTAGIHATALDANLIGGIYANTGDPQNFATTGKLQKFGTGVLAFENTGGNLFEEGVELYDGVIEFNMANQLYVGTGKDITFIDNAILRPTASLTQDTTIAIVDGRTGTFDVGQDITYTYTGGMISGIAGAITKTGAGTMEIRADSSLYQGGITVSGGTLGIYTDYGNAASFTVGNGGTLAGTGTIGARSAGGVIESGGILAPRGMADYLPGNNPTADSLTVNGDLAFAEGSTFDVTLTQYDNNRPDGKFEPVSERVDVAGGGLVTIDRNANLNVTIDYWNDTTSIYDYNNSSSDRFTIIDATHGQVEDADARFILNMKALLPRGVQLVQGWNQSLYQLWFEGDPAGTFESISTRHNRTQIGRNLDQLITLRDPGLSGLIGLLSSPAFNDSQVSDLLDRLTGDIGANALDMSLKKPWRMPFGRLDTFRRNCFGPESQENLVNGTRTDRVMKRVWAEYYNNHSNFDFDRNAHEFSLNRNGVVLGYDYQLTDNFVLGGVFNYSNPRLKQSTGTIATDDFEFGLYNLIRLREDFEVKVYAGYAHQRHDIKRRVDLPGVDALPDGIHDSFQNNVSGHSLSASLQVARPFCLTARFRLTPVIALDYEQAWIEGYRESGGLSSLEYRKSDLMSFVARVGAEVDVAANENITVRARAYYGRQLNKRDYGAVDVRFAGAQTTDHRYANIHGVQTGRNHVNLGAGMDWKINPARNLSMYVHYDADLYKNVTTHTGQIGFSLEW